MCHLYQFLRSGRVRPILHYEEWPKILAHRVTVLHILGARDCHSSQATWFWVTAIPDGKTTYNPDDGLTYPACGGYQEVGTAWCSYLTRIQHLLDYSSYNSVVLYLVWQVWGVSTAWLIYCFCLKTTRVGQKQTHRLWWLICCLSWIEAFGCELFLYVGYLLVGVDRNSWGFGQVVATTFWVPTIVEYIQNDILVFEGLAAKGLAGFPIGVADYLGWKSGYEYLPGANGGLNVTMSSIANQSKFLGHEMPFSILQATALAADDVVYLQYLGLKVPYDNDTFYEFTPFEMGSWDKRVAAFTPMEWTGTRLENGVPVNSSQCIRGFDHASYLLGSAAAAWNFWYIGDYSNQTLAQFPKRALDPVSSAVRRITKMQFHESTIVTLDAIFQKIFNLTMPEIAYATWPNPFTGTSASTNASEYVQFVDATEAGTSFSLFPLVQPARNASFFIAWDDNGETIPYEWLNGTNFHNAYLEAKAAGLPFPIVPDPTTMVNRNYTFNPTFFGCDTKLTTTNSTESPIILYMTNSPYSAYTNFSWTQNTFSLTQLHTIFTNEFNQFTQGNGTLDPEWNKCLGCAVIDRSLEKIGMRKTEQCQKCLNKYCWDGTYDETPAGILDPTLRLDPGLGYLEWNETNSV